MPNKHKKKKIFNKLLISGKLDKKEHVQKSREILEAKQALDQEDIDFDYEPSKNGDFEKLDPSEDVPIKKTKGKKRKLPEIKVAPEAAKKPKTTPAANGGALPKKSKNNKYFFLAHPEALKKKEEILTDGDKSNKFVIDKEKMKLNKKKLKKKAASNENGVETNGSKNTTKKEKKSELKSKNAKLWAIEECSSSDENENEQTNKPVVFKAPLIDIVDIDKSFKIKKTMKKMEDGSMVEIVCPEMLQNEDEEEEEEEENGDNIPIEKEDDDEEVEENQSSNPLADKLKSSRFRFINEMLYTQPSQKSFEYFKE